MQPYSNGPQTALHIIFVGFFIVIKFFVKSPPLNGLTTVFLFGAFFPYVRTLFYLVVCIVEIILDYEIVFIAYQTNIALDSPNPALGTVFGLCMLYLLAPIIVSSILKKMGFYTQVEKRLGVDLK